MSGRDGYETDLTDTEWAVIAPLMPEPASRGRPLVWAMRDVLNAMASRAARRHRVASDPKDLPPRSTIYRYFSRAAARVRRIAPTIPTKVRLR